MHCDQFFSHYGIPETVMSDSGPQYSSCEFAKSCNFHDITSNLLFPQSNDQVEQTIQTAKKLLKRSDDPYTALLMYRSTPGAICHQPSYLWGDTFNILCQLLLNSYNLYMDISQIIFDHIYAFSGDRELLISIEDC